MMGYCTTISTPSNLLLWEQYMHFHFSNKQTNIIFSIYLYIYLERTKKEADTTNLLEHGTMNQ